MFIPRLKIFFFIITSLFLGISCQGQPPLPPTQFSKMIADNPNSYIIDVRTPKEFEQGHLINAQNINFHDPKFSQLLPSTDKTKPIFVYCLVGGRSMKATKQLRSKGYSKVYDLEGGILNWRKENLPEINENKNTGITKAQYEQFQNNSKTVLINFFAKWCPPCKKMEPFIEKISKEMKSTVEVVRIDADDNQKLIKELGISALPVLQVFKSNTLVWSNVGYASKKQIISHLE